MPFYRWPDCPPEVQREVGQIVQPFIQHVPFLAGIYLHGSPAMGCFNPARSDLDLLVVTQNKLPSSAVPPILHTLLEISGNPIPVEVSFLNLQDLKPWQHPALYDLHYSEGWREEMSRRLQDGSWRENFDLVKRDRDLAAHITITHQFGICLWGEPINAIFPTVPAADFADSILADVEWIGERMMSFPTYTVLNLCRVYAFMQCGLVCSKAGGARWALQHLDEKWHGNIQKALDDYQSETAAPFFIEDEIKSFYNEMVQQILLAKSSRPEFNNHNE